MKRPKQMFAEYTCLQDDVLETAWDDWLRANYVDGVSWTAWWADHQGEYV